MTEKKDKILILTPGPKYNLEHEFGKRLMHMSDYYAGALLTSSDQIKDFTVGKFTVRSIVFHKRRSPALLLRYFLAARRIIRENKGEIKLITTYDPLLTGLIAMLLAKIYKIKFAPEVNGDYTSWENYSEIKNHFIKRIKRFVYMRLESFVLARADGIKIQFENQVQCFRKKIKTNIFCMSPNYVDLNAFSNQGEQKIVLLVGFPFNVKGVDILIAAFKKIEKQHPDWKLKILGWYPNNSELAQHIGGDEQIFHHQPVEHNEMPRHVGTCGIYVSASRTEGVARVLLESMASGKPRIASNVGGSHTVIEHAVDGYLFESLNVDALAQHLDLLMSDAQLRNDIGQRARARAEQEFMGNAYFEKIDAFYKAVINS